MKRIHTLFALLLLLVSSVALSQRPFCASDQIHTKRLKTDRLYKMRIAAQSESIRQYIQKNKARLSAKTYRTMAALYTIPVVVHVVHTGGALGSIYNPTDAQIAGAINYLNEVYAGTYGGTEGIGDIEIQFVLAKRDPNCNPTNGINRINGSVINNYVANGVDADGSNTANEANQLNVKNLIRWNTSSYYNIWVVNKIDGLDGTSGSFTAGFAYFPGAPSSLDGTIMLATQMIAGEKTLPHEIGHALALHHPFYDEYGAICAPNTSCENQGDYVCDTEPVSEPEDLFTCRTGTNPCGGTYSINTEKNYMNYTSCHTLFTAGQKARMLAAMTLPSRACFTSSLGAFAPNEGSVCAPKINFEFSEDQKTENTSITTGCRTYSDYTYNMVIGTTPSATATATLNIASATATEGVDYDITTNGDFASPNKVLTFASGSTAAQPFTVRIYNDAIVDGIESFTLGFTVNSGGGNAVAGNGRPNLVFTIADNDNAPTTGTAVGTASIGATAYNISSPFDARQQKQRTQFLYKASELTAAGVPSGLISGFALNLQKLSTRSFSNFSIKMGAINTPYLVDGEFLYTTVLTTVKTVASFTTVSGWNNFVFDNVFAWNGTSNIIIELCFDNGTAAAGNAADNIRSYSDGGTASQGNVFWQAGISCSESFSNVEFYGTGVKPIIRFSYGVPTTPVQSVLNASKTEYLGPNADVYFYDQTDSKLLARIRNLSNHNYGCTQVVIDRAGTGTTAFWNNNVSNSLMNKTFRVIPTTNNASGQYEITLYYSDAEKAAWEGATGQSWSSIQLIKVPSQVSNYSPSTPNPDGPGMIQTATPTRATLGSQHSLTTTFNTGFSGFGAGITGIALPVNLVSFDGNAEKENIALKWVTSFEENTKDFEVEKSSDGANFYTIGTIKANGNSSSNSQYNFKDYQVGEVNYYRLKSNDADGRYTLSKVILIKYDKAEQNTWVINNPFNQHIDLSFAKKAKQVKLQLVNTNGSIVAGQNLMQQSGQVRWSIGMHLPSGVYVLRAIVDGEVFSHKVIKE